MKCFSVVYLFSLALMLIICITNSQAQNDQIDPAVLEIVNRISAEHQKKLFQQAPVARSLMAQPEPLNLEIVWN